MRKGSGARSAVCWNEMEYLVEAKMKKISVMIPCFNEVENVEPISEAVVKMLETELSNYDYEILFIDNCSTDGTRDKLEKDLLAE